MYDEEMSRRVFLTKCGKAIGLGILAHFTLVGDLMANDSEENVAKTRVTCGTNQPNTCGRLQEVYKCSDSSRHSCGFKFSCVYDFTCNPMTSNNCKDKDENKCEPVPKFKAE